MSTNSSSSETAFGSCPNCTERAFRVARRWANVPDEMSNEEAMLRGFITPEMLLMIMTIINEVFQCLSNRPMDAFRRVRGYVEETREVNRLGDSVRLTWMIDRWMIRLGHPRDRGDVVELRNAIVEDAETMSEAEFQSLQTEMLFLTI